MNKTRVGGKIFLSLATLLIFFTVRDSIFNVGVIRAWHWQPVNLVNTYYMTVGKFKGWYVYPEYGKRFETMVKILSDEIPATDTVAIIGDMTAAYGVANRESFRGMPFIFHYPEFPRAGKYTIEVGDRIRENPPQWIVVHHNEFLKNWLDFDRLQTHFGITDFFKENYRSQKRVNKIEIFKLHRSL